MNKEEINRRDLKLLELLSKSRRDEIATALRLQNNFVKLFGFEAYGELLGGTMTARPRREPPTIAYPYDGMR